MIETSGSICGPLLIVDPHRRVGSTPSGDNSGSGRTITFRAIARRAGGSSQWLYTQPIYPRGTASLRDRGPFKCDGVQVRQCRLI